MFIGPMEDPAQRKVIVTGLREKAPGVGFKPTQAWKVEGQWNRIVGSECILEWNEDEEPEPDVMRAATKKKLDELYPRFEKLTDVLRRLTTNTPSSK
jgi:hypothetical protein